MFNIKNNPFSDLQSLEKLTDSEIITPFEVVKKMVELLPEEVFTNLNNRFIDVSTKSGIYLKYIFFNLLHKLPNIQLSKNNNQLDYELDEDYDFTNLDDKKRFILRYMIYGIATSELSFLTSKRTLYENINENEDSEKNGKILSKPIFKNWEGNIVYKKLNNEEYWFLETDIETINKELTKNIILKKDKEMKFNVIIGNPPYQKNDGGGKGNNSKPIYNLFIDKSKELKPNYMSFIIPSRWMSGGRGLDNFRKSMLNDKRFKKIIDFKNSLDCFSNVDIKGGICYFLWELKYANKCEYTIKKKEKGKEIIVSNQYRDLNKYDVLIRDNKAINILEKVLNKIELFNKKRNIVYMNKKVSSQSFYADMNARLFQKELKYNENIYLKGNGYKVYVNKDTFPKSNNGIGYIEKDLITKTNIGKYINNHKVFIPKTFRELKNKPFYGEPNSICSETYIVIDICKNKKEANNLINYFNTDLVSFLIKQKKITHNSSKETYSFIPSLNMKYNWTNEKLYKLFNISNSEIEYMSKSIKDMAKLI